MFRLRKIHANHLDVRVPVKHAPASADSDRVDFLKLDVLGQRIFAAFPSNTALLEASKRKIWLEDVCAVHLYFGVQEIRLNMSKKKRYPDGPGFQFVRCLDRPLDVFRKYGGR